MPHANPSRDRVTIPDAHRIACMLLASDVELEYKSETVSPDLSHLTWPYLTIVSSMISARESGGPECLKENLKFGIA